MASSIISTTIDENFPVAGQDNDSQGFRDNFSIIKTALSVAKSEITDLQDGVARIDTNNNFDGNSIIEANLLATTLESNLTLITGTAISQNVSWNEGYAHVIKATNDITLSITNLPTTNYSFLKLIIFADDSPRDISIIVSGGGTVKVDESSEWTGNTITVTSSTSPVVVDVFSYNGLDIFLKYVGTFS